MNKFAKVVKLSESGKTMLVGVKLSKYSIGYSFGWASNPDGLVVGDEVPEFEPTGTTQCTDDKGEPIFYEDGAPVLRWVF